MTSAQRAQYLEAMGVQVWLERVDTTGLVGEGAAKVIVEPNALPSAVSVQAGLWVVADINSTEADALFGNMLQAIGVKRQSVRLMSTAQGLSLNEQLLTHQPRAVLILGNVATESSLSSNLTLSKLADGVYNIQNIKAVVTPSLDELLHQPALKRTAWNSMQSIRPLLTL